MCVYVWRTWLTSRVHLSHSCALQGFIRHSPVNGFTLRRISGTPRQHTSGQKLNKGRSYLYSKWTFFCNEKRKFVERISLVNYLPNNIPLHSTFIGHSNGFIDEILVHERRKYFHRKNKRESILQKLNEDQPDFLRVDRYRMRRKEWDETKELWKS